MIKRCPICDWPMANDPKDGCVDGDCSYRPDPRLSPDEYARVQRNRKALAYRNSPEGKAAALKSDQERASMQAKHDALMARLPSLDWKNDDAVMGWLCDMQEPSDRVGVIVRRESIVSTFERHGFEAGANCGPDYRGGDLANMFRYLVGQALDGLKNGPAIHPVTLDKEIAFWDTRDLALIYFGIKAGLNFAKHHHMPPKQKGDESH